MYDALRLALVIIHISWWFVALMKRTCCSQRNRTFPPPLHLGDSLFIFCNPIDITPDAGVPGFWTKSILFSGCRWLGPARYLWPSCWNTPMVIKLTTNQKWAKITELIHLLNTAHPHPGVHISVENHLYQEDTYMLRKLSNSFENMFPFNVFADKT